MTTTLDYYTSIKTPTVVSGITSTDWFNLIGDNEYRDTIIDLRNGYGDKTTIKESLPCVTYNYNFNTTRRNVNVCGSTGLLFIDIDDSTFNPSQIDSSKVYAYYKSLGGNGYHIIVKVEDIPTESYKATYSQIVSELGIEEYVDINASKLSQPTVLSYDSDIYVNDNAYVFSATSEVIKSAPNPSVYNKKKKTYAKGGGQNEDTPWRIRYDDLHTKDIDGDYTLDWGNIEYVKAFIPKNISNGNRASSLMAYAVNLLYLNPWLYKEKLIEMLNNVNNVMCKEPLGSNQIYGIAENVFKYKEDDTLEPIKYYKNRSFNFKESNGWTREDKMEVVGLEMGKMYYEQSTQKLNDIIVDWDWDKYGKISQRKIYNNHSIGKNTVEKYWGEFKEYVTGLNDEYKLNNK